mgnify:CR=1 FL=1
MSELYEKSQVKLELNQVLKQLSTCAGSNDGKAACLALKPSSDLEQVQVWLDETTAAANLATNKGYPGFAEVRDVSASLDRAHRGGTLQPRELLQIAGVLRCSRNVKAYISEDEQTCALTSRFHMLTTNKYLEDKIFGAILSEEEIADTYLNNMGAYYGNEKNWETFRQYAFEAALTRTDVVVQPRQSNTWGALSLDHVYEFMGGMNLAVRNVTGKDPDAYLSDYRNRNNNRMQELKEAIGVESRTTIFNPAYIKEKMKGEASSANTFSEIVRNTYGWNVMKPKAVDKELWDEIYNVYVKDKFNLGLKEFFENQNPAALEEMTAVMLETVRKGMWKASEQQVADLTQLHTELVNKYKPSCSGFVCDNAKLRDFIASKVDAQTAAEYQKNISQIRESVAQNDNKGVVMKKEELNQVAEQQTQQVDSLWIAIAVVLVLVGLAVLMRRRRKNNA